MIKNHNHVLASETAPKGVTASAPLGFVAHGTGEQLSSEIRKDWDTMNRSHLYQKSTPVIRYEFERDILFFWKHLLTKLGWDIDYPELKDVAIGKRELRGSTEGELTL